MKIYLPTILVILLSVTRAFSAACCGGGSSGGNFLSNAQNSLFAVEYNYNRVVIGSVSNEGLWRKSPEAQQVSTLTWGGAYLLSDLWQASLSLPVVARELGSEKHQNIGDLNLGLAYEFMPDWDYHPYRPRGLVYFGLTSPTGRSPQESKIGGLDSSGKGFWDLQTGILLTKTIRKWDFSLNLQIHQSLAREFQSPTNTGIEPQKETPSLGSKLSLGTGYNIGDHRWGFAATDVFEGSQKVETLRSTFRTGTEKFTTASFSYTYSISDTSLVSATYFDQTLLGSPQNTSLGQGASMSYQQAWNR